MTTKRAIKARTKAGLAVFIDLLGFGQRVKSVETFEDLVQIKKQIDIAHNFFDIDNNSEFRKQYLKSTGQVDFALSDSIFTFIPLQSQVISYTEEFGSVMSDLVGIAYSQMDCVMNGVFVRGAVSLGWYYQDKKNFISDALVEAVSLEKLICYPVICISDSIIDRYKASKERNYYSENLDPFKNNFFLTISIDSKSLNFINYLKICIEAVSPNFSSKEKTLLRTMSSEAAQEFQNKKYWETQAEYLIQHKTAIEQGVISSAKNKRALAKYNWLKKYHNSIAEPFKTINPNVMIRKLSY